MRRHGASRAATTAFLLSTPQTGVDSLLVTYALLGPVFAAFRPIAALVSGMFGGALVLLVGESKQERAAEEASPPVCNEACCTDTSNRHFLLRALNYGLVALPRDVGVALLVGVAIAGGIGVLAKPDLLHVYLGGGIVSILLLMAAGVPVYVCATASAPIAAGFIHMGASPGAALAFLITGAATNPATFTTVWKILGRRTALVYLATVAVSALVCGLLLDQVFVLFNATTPHMSAHQHEMAHGGWLPNLWAVALLAVLVNSYFVAWRQRATQGAKSHDHHDHAHHEHGEHGEHDGQRPLAGQPGLQSVELAIAGMTCDHCAARVRDALAECRGVQAVEVNVNRGVAIVSGVALDPELLSTTVTELGYTIES